MFPSEKTPPCTRHAQEPVEETMVAALYWQLCGVHQLELRARARLIGGGHDRT
jgi:hypothetical protein